VIRVRGLLGLVFAGAVAIALPGCGDKNNTPTTPTPTATTFAEIFSGELNPRGIAFYSFATSQTEKLGVTLASLGVDGSITPLTSALNLGLGFPSGTGCTLRTQQTVTPGLSAQISQSIDAGTYCVNITDPGNLAATSIFVIRIYHDISTTAPASSTKNDVFISSLSVHGTSSKSFTVGTAGTLSVSLDGVTPATSIGLGIGLFRNDGGGCALSRSIVSTAGVTAQVSTPIDPGSYCIKVFDVGTLSDPVAFSIGFSHPS